MSVRFLFMNPGVLPASCRETNQSKALPGTCVWSPGFSRSGPPEGGTPYRWHDPDGFMVPMRGRRAEGALHEPTHPRPLQGGEQSFVPFLSVPLLGGVRGEFMVPRHGIKVVGAFQEQIIETYFRHHIKNCEE